MNKKMVTGIVFLMVLVLAGLIFIQVYWIKNAISLKEQQFDQHVKEALIQVANRVEQQDAMHIITHEFRADPNLHRVFNFPGFPNTQLWDMGRDINNVVKQFDREMDKWKNVIWSGDQSIMPRVMVHGDTVHSHDTGVGYYESTIQIQINDSVEEICVTNNSQKQVQKMVDHYLHKIERKKSLVNDIFFQFLRRDIPIEERINKKELGNFITHELGVRGIDLDYEYLILDQYGNVEGKSDHFKGEYVSKASTINLFPNEMFSDPYHLLVHFPSKDRHIVSSLGLMSFTSLSLILIISMCFAYTIFIIFRQKKLADMKTDFINNMTHELKTPVATISLATEMLTDQDVSKDNKKMNKYAHVIQDENKRLGGQIEKVLQMSILDKGDLNLKMTEIDVHDIIDSVIQKLTLQLESYDGKVDLKLNASNFRIKADKVHFENIIINLLDNAMKYSIDKPDIMIRTTNGNGKIKIAISDKGIGMSKEVQKRIFEKFYRVPTGNIHDVKGFGLGLSYVKAMVEAHSGEVDLVSEPKKGSTFTITMPII